MGASVKVLNSLLSRHNMDRNSIKDYLAYIVKVVLDRSSIQDYLAYIVKVSELIGDWGSTYKTYIQKV